MFRKAPGIIPGAISRKGVISGSVLAFPFALRVVGCSRNEGSRIKRGLAAVMAADVLGYSRLMEKDEEGTPRRVAELFAKLVSPAIDVHGGRLIRTAGDRLLVL
jgi:class 3 adenylate cyclase